MRRMRALTDRGVVKVVTRSDGIFHHQVFARGREVEHAKKLQRGLARTRKGSARRRKASARVADLARKVRRRRADFAAKTACVLATSFELAAQATAQTAPELAGIPRPQSWGALQIGSPTTPCTRSWSAWNWWAGSPGSGSRAHHRQGPPAGCTPSPPPGGRRTPRRRRAASRSKRQALFGDARGGKAICVRAGRNGRWRVSARGTPEQ